LLNNYTDNELINMDPKTDLEAELIKRFSGNTEKDWDDLEEREQKWHTKYLESQEFADSMRDQLRKLATEIHRCAFFGVIENTPEFRQACREVIDAIDEVVDYKLPTGVEPLPINNSSSFRACGEA